MRHQHGTLIHLNEQSIVVVLIRSCSYSSSSSKEPRYHWTTICTLDNYCGWPNNLGGGTSLCLFVVETKVSVVARSVVNLAALWLNKLVVESSIIQRQFSWLVFFEGAFTSSRALECCWSLERKSDLSGEFRTFKRGSINWKYKFEQKLFRIVGQMDSNKSISGVD